MTQANNKTNSESIPRVLFLSFWAPPAIQPRAIAAGKIVPELARILPHLVVMRYRHPGRWDTLVPVYEVSEWKPAPLALPFLSRIGNKLRKWRYMRALYRQARAIIAEHKINLVFSFANPKDSNLLGARIKKKLGIPFISHFSDPWVDNPYAHYSPLSLFFEKRREKSVIDGSDRILFTNEEAMHLVLSKYSGAARTRGGVIPHAFRKSDYPKQEREEQSGGKRFVISYIGVFYKERNPEPLFRALCSLRVRSPELFQRISVRLVGADNDYTSFKGEHLATMIREHGLAGVVAVLPRVEFKQSLEEMSRADCLIVIDADFEKSPFLPSKLIDYLGSGRPIIGITPPGSPTAAVLARAGFSHFAPGDTELLSRSLEEFMTRKKLPSPDREYIETFEAGAVAKMLAEEMRRVVALRPHPSSEGRGGVDTQKAPPPTSPSKEGKR